MEDKVIEAKLPQAEDDGQVEQLTTMVNKSMVDDKPIETIASIRTHEVNANTNREERILDTPLVEEKNEKSGRYSNL